MIWEVKPLEGKYYSTTVTAGPLLNIEVALGNGAPSARQIARWIERRGINWDSAPQEDRDDLQCDGHYETAETYEAACRIVAALNEQPDKPGGGA